MPERSEREVGGAAVGKDRFDGQTVRRILERAVEEQHRARSELADSYSREELEEMAAEAGISPTALQAAIRKHATEERLFPTRRPTSKARRFLRFRASSTGARFALIGTGVAVIGLLFAFPAVAETLLWATLLALVVLSVLVLLGGPF